MLVGRRPRALVAGNVDFALMGNILIGSLPGVVIGTALIDRSRPSSCAPRSAASCSARALGVFTKAGVDLPTWTIVGVPAIVGAVAAVIHRTRPIRPRHTDAPTTEAAPA